MINLTGTLHDLDTPDLRITPWQAVLLSLALAGTLLFYKRNRSPSSFRH